MFIQRRIVHSIVCGLAVFGSGAGKIPVASGQTVAGDLFSDTWVATDALGRTLPTAREVGAPRANKFVGIFYFLWLGAHGTAGPYDLSKIIAANPDNPAYGPAGLFHHWHESELGYYLSTDPYVIRRHCSMLVDAGIDVVIFDVTNGFTYKDTYLLVCSIYDQIRKAGGRTPQVAFLANSSSAVVVQTLYNDLYSKNLYQDLWFRWNGKPLMMASPADVAEPSRSFFTFRHSWAWTDPNGWFGNGQDKWPWLDNWPQHFGWHEPGVPEHVSVSVAQHPVSNIGRSSISQVQPPPDQWKTPEGPCFDQQFKRALEVDPQFIFITGWNEWVAQRFINDAGGQPFLGKPLPPGGTFFVDAYSQEFSRDIEPMKGGHTDNYYYQMIANIRRFKGARELEAPGAARTIAIDGKFADWNDVAPEYRDTAGDTVHRSHPGWGSAGTYTNTTGRNDIVVTKVARDDTFVSFYCRTQAPLTSPAGSNWMLLFIDADLDRSTGWEGYDYIVNAPASATGTTTLKRNTGGWNWTSVASVPLAIAGNEMELRIPRSLIGQALTPDVSFDFHWADNIQKTGDIIEFAISGDSAPNRRFNYRYTTDRTAPDDVAALAAYRSATQVSVAWTNPTTADVSQTMIRYRTDTFPGSPGDGTLLCERTAAPGTHDSFAHAADRRKCYYYAAFTCDRMKNYSQGRHAESRALADADFDADGDVDQSDFARMQRCLTGTGQRYADPGCAAVDFDQDGDVDGDDFAVLLRCWTGANVPSATSCAGD